MLILEGIFSDDITTTGTSFQDEPWTYGITKHLIGIYKILKCSYIYPNKKKKKKKKEKI